jgi:hypothetical protein
MSKLLMAGMMLIGLLASCSENDKSPIEKGKSMKLTLNLTSPTVTKTAITDDPNTTTYIASESTINNVVVALFDVSGNLVGGIQSFSSSQVTNHQVSATGSSSMTQVAVAVNVPAASFANVKTLSDFEGVQASLDNTATSDASAAGATQQYATALPMAGEGTVTIAQSAGTATVTLTRLVGKVILSGISPNFSGVYANASFTPTEVFMYNVPSTANCNAQSATSAIASAPTFLQGEQVSPLLTTNPKNYLGTGALSGAVQTIPWSNQYFSFYVFPNNNSTTQTQLIIKGLFKMNSSDTGTTVYYPITLNSGAVQNNKVYNLTAVIGCIGTTDPRIPLNVPVGVTLTVANWASTITQGTTF